MLAQAPLELHTPQEFHAVLQTVTTAIHKAVESNVSETKPTPYSKRLWTHDLTKMEKTNKTKARRAYRHRSDPDHEAHREYDEGR